MLVSLQYLIIVNKCELTKLGNVVKEEFADEERFSFLIGGGE